MIYRVPHCLAAARPGSLASPSWLGPQSSGWAPTSCLSHTLHVWTCRSLILGRSSFHHWLLQPETSATQEGLPWPTQQSRLLTVNLCHTPQLLTPELSPQSEWPCNLFIHQFPVLIRPTWKPHAAGGLTVLLTAVFQNREWCPTRGRSSRWADAVNKWLGDGINIKTLVSAA